MHNDSAYVAEIKKFPVSWQQWNTPTWYMRLLWEYRACLFKQRMKELDGQLAAKPLARTRLPTAYCIS